MVYPTSVSLAFCPSTKILLTCPYVLTYPDAIMKRLQFYLRTSQIKRLKAIAKLTGAPVAELVRRAVDEFIQRRKAAQESNHHGETEEQGNE
jgi:hypothetical protein